MRILGIMNSDKCFDIIEVIFTKNGEDFYRQAYLDNELNYLVEAMPHCDSIDIMRDTLEKFILQNAHKLNNMILEEYGFVKNTNVKSFIYDFRPLDNDFCIQKDLDLSGNELILGFKFGDLIFIGNKKYILEHLDLLIGKPSNQNEYELLFKLFIEAYEFERAKEVAMMAINEDIADKNEWQKKYRYVEARITAKAILKEITDGRQGAKLVVNL